MVTLEKTTPAPVSPSIAEGTCALCGRKGGRIIQRGLRGGHKIDAVQCLCGFVYLWPLPSAADEAAFYKGNQQWKEIYGDIPIDDAYMFTKCEPDAERRITSLKRYFHPTSRLLEIGCGHGNFLAKAKPQVKEAVGLELGIDKIKFCRTQLGLDIFDNFDALVESGRKFDLICLFHVLEHLREPVSLLRNLGKVLAPQGIIIFEVPNFWDPMLTLYRIDEFKQFYFQLAHVNYFSPRTLRQTAKQAGYRIEIQGLQRYGLKNHLHWIRQRKPMLDNPLASWRGPLSYVDLLYRKALQVSPFADTLLGICQFNT